MNSSDLTTLPAPVAPPVPPPPRPSAARLLSLDAYRGLTFWLVTLWVHRNKFYVRI
jgi:hypothetical protein